MKVVIFSHGHPKFSKGGGEYAAYYLWQAIDAEPGHAAWFVGRGQPEVMHKFSSLAAVGERDYLVSGNAILSDLVATAPLTENSDLAQLLRRIQPDVVHFHHYVHLGIELIRLVRKVCPSAKLFLTLHEFIAICLNNGQMVKPNGELCHSYSPRECHLCFPHLSAEDIFLREQYIKSFFGLVDGFISPSEFLRRRYIDWGIDPGRITVIENGLPVGERVPLRQIAAGESRGRFAYFGQINPYKGVDVILDAFVRLAPSVRRKVSLDVFGSALHNQAPEFRARVEELLKRAGTMVRLHGPYDPSELARLMAGVDWVIMGSVWWENSPLVIQEAFKFGRPIITPDIGGMAEKVVPGRGGMNYRAGDSVSLASLLAGVVEDNDLYERCCASMPRYSSINDALSAHLDFYAAHSPVAA
jgi:glycosyltransferase involved in cell wall biosynthesis